MGLPVSYDGRFLALLRRCLARQGAAEHPAVRRLSMARARAQECRTGSGTRCRCTYCR